MIATGVALDATAERLCYEIEALLPGVACSVLRVDDSGILQPLAAPSLPEEFSEIVRGTMIGPEVGSCGSAAYLREPVAVTDIETDPRWAAFKQLVVESGFKACWSVPIYNAEGAVFGTFALYFKEQRVPSPHEQDLVSASIHLSAIALERHDRVLERERRGSIDALTDLPNRSSYDAALEQLSDEEPGSWALMILDLDNLKTINDTFGHPAGDQLLRTVAQRIAKNVLPDKVFRLGGDEFAIILKVSDAVADLNGTAERILEAVSEVASCDGHMLQPRATIGGAASSPRDKDPATVHKHADFALYHAKETGRGGFVRYWPGIGTTIKQRMEVIQDVGSALDDGRIEAYYQPVVRLETREIVGMEALCRLRRPEGNVVSAGAFHQATTDVEVSARLTEGMLALVAADIRSWLEAGIPFQDIGVNISSADFHSGTLFDRIEAAFGRENVPLKHVILEVTESVYLGQNDPIVAEEIKSLRSKGLRIALDDFGTGFASLRHLLTVPVDIIKIDRSFVSQLQVDHRSMAIIGGLLEIARKLDMRVVAEGIETEDQANLLAEIGCNLGQGYLFSAAVPHKSATELLIDYAQGRTVEKAESLRGLTDRFVASRATRERAQRAKKGSKPGMRDPADAISASQAN